MTKRSCRGNVSSFHLRILLFHYFHDPFPLVCLFRRDERTESVSLCQSCCVSSMVLVSYLPLRSRHRSRNYSMAQHDDTDARPRRMISFSILSPLSHSTIIVHQPIPLRPCILYVNDGQMQHHSSALSSILQTSLRYFAGTVCVWIMQPLFFAQKGFQKLTHQRIRYTLILNLLTSSSGDISFSTGESQIASLPFQ